MTIRNAKHASFTIERTYPVAPARVFAAWSDKEAKTAWAYCHAEWPVKDHVFDFRVGGREYLVTGPVGGTRHVFNGHFFDIVPDQRIVFAYDMHLDDRRISVSLTTIEFFAVAGGTRMVFTEQGAFLDGYDDIAGREEGTRIGLGNLDRLFGQQQAA
ncbi:MAG: SRPBCC family protein [Rhodospirillales bacterium]|nr:SRPBCC family protein [Rhodospirillales bacterium]